MSVTLACAGQALNLAGLHALMSNECATYAPLVA